MRFILIISFLYTAFVCSEKQEPVSQKNITSAGQNETSAGQPEKEDLVIKTSDTKDISASFFYSEGKKEQSAPLVILIHQFNQSKEQWKSDFVDSLLAAGFKVLAYDIRGHGKSSKVQYELSKLLEDPEEAPNDLKAVIDWARSRKGIDSSRIGIMGTSIGGNLACYAALNLGAKAIVSISNGQKTFEIYTGYNELMLGRPYFPKFRNALFICGSKDGDHEKGQKWIIDNFADVPRDHKVYESSKHGMYLLEDFPEINTISINWFKKYL
jgi:esterase/lipase